MLLGNGRGWCKHVKEWYTSKDPMVLAKEMSRVKARHGRSHKTLLRKSHVKIAENDFGKYVVRCFVNRIKIQDKSLIGIE